VAKTLLKEYSTFKEGRRLQDDIIIIIIIIIIIMFIKG